MALGSDASNRMGSPQAIGATFFNKSINQSLRFEDGDSPYLRRTMTAGTDNKKYTFSAWVKRSNISASQAIFSAGDGSTNSVELRFGSSDNLEYLDTNNTYLFITSAAYRDPSTWYHIVMRVDTTQLQEEQRARLYVNGEEVVNFSTDNRSQYALNEATTMNTAQPLDIGRWVSGSEYFDGYIAEVYYSDGYSYGPEYYGENKNGVWIPKEPDITYGTNGFHLDFLGETGGFSAYFDGVGDNITWTDASNFDIGSSDDFCLELFHNGDYQTTYSYGFGDYTNSGFLLNFASSRNIYFYVGIGASIGPFDVSSYVNVNTWHHYAVVRHSGTYYIYVDGVQRGTSSSSGTAEFNNARFQVGDAHSSAGAPHLLGYVSNLRFTIGSARYPSGTTFTVPTSTLTSDSTNVKLLAFTNSTITNDASSFNHTGVIDEGAPVFSSYGPFAGSLLSEDKSGNDNHFSTSGIASTDVLPDSPTNNMCVLSTTNRYTSAVGHDVREGGLEERGNSTGTCGTVTFDATDEKGFYFEVTHTGTPGGGCTHGMMNFTDSINTHGGVPGDSDRSGWWGVYRRGAGGSNQFWYYLDGVETATLGTAGAADDVWMYLIKAGKFYIGRNGTWFNSGNPAAGTGYYATGLTGTDWTIFSGNGYNVTGGHKIRVSRDTWSHGDASYKEVKALNIQEPIYSPRNESIENSYFYTTLYEGNGGGQRVGQFLPLTETKSVNNALRFNDDDTQYLSYTPSASNRRTFTFSAWIKVNPAAANYPPLFNADTSTPDSVIRLGGGGTAGQIEFVVENGGGGNALLITNRKLKDPSVWYHIVCNMDTTNSTADQRLRIYIDGTEETSFASRTNPDLNDEYKFNSNVIHKLGAQRYASYWDGYMADVHFVDGLQLDASYFGQTDPSTEKWIPKTYTGSHGTNGFHLEFENPELRPGLGGIGDSSTTNNHFTPVNFGTANTIIDTPTDNFPVLTNLPANHGGTLAKGNLQTTVTGFSGSAYGGGRSTIPLPKTGKWYCEVRGMATGDLWTAGVSTDTDVPSIGTVAGPGAIAVYNRSVIIGFENDYGASENQLAGLGITKFASGDILGIHVDMDAGGKVWFSHNGTQFDAPQGHQAGSGPQGDPAAGTNEIGTVYNPNNEDIFFHLGGSSSTVCHINFGQNPSFNGSLTGGDVGTQVREGGTFKYMPATGYKPLRVDLLPDQTRDVARRKKPVITWIKNRDSTDSHMLFDTLRGPTKVAHPDTNAAETTEVNTLQKFVPGGFQIGNDVQVNTAGESYVAWNWCMHDDVVEDVPTGSGFSNGRRLVDKRVGLSIVTYTATAGTGTIDHGLGQTPDMIIATDRGHDVNWFVWHTGLANAAAGTHIMNLDTGAAEFNPGVNHLNDTAPTASAFAFGGYMGAHSDTSASGQTKMFYAFKSVPGYSKFGFYTGNAAADGTFVHLGFRPAWLMIADTTTTNIEWNIFDDRISPFNVMNDRLAAASNAAEGVDISTRNLDFVSNGIKFRDQYAQNYAARHIYWAMAESPFKYANAR